MITGPLILIGQAPGRHPRHDPDRHALFPYPPGCAGAKLMELMDLAMMEYISIKRRNVFRRWPGGDGGGDRFPLKEARRRARAMEPELYDHRVVFVGRAVARAFGHGEAELFGWRYNGEYHWCVVPHPSGRNRWWNDPANRAKAEGFLRDLGREYRDHSGAEE